MTISVTRGLAELKILDSRINAAITGGIFVGAIRGDQKQPIGVVKTAEQLDVDIKASYQSVNELIKRRGDIKRAIIVSNGSTTVTIGAESMTVAEAIERKSSIAYLKTYVAYLQAQRMQAINVVNTQNARVDADIEKKLLTVYGADKAKISKDDSDVITKAVKKEHQASLLDPNNIEQQIANFKKQYEDFETEVDFVLSESNAKTEITI